MTKHRSVGHPDLSQFDASTLDRGRSKRFEILWWIAKLMFIQSALPWPSRLKRFILIRFGASVGKGLYMRPGVNIHFPWKLRLGENVWIGERCTLLNLEPIHIDSNSALAHEVYLAAASHDISSPDFAYRNAPIHIESGAWIATRAFVGPGVKIGSGAIVAAGSVVTRDVEPWTVVAGNPAKIVTTRKITVQ